MGGQSHRATYCNGIIAAVGKAVKRRAVGASGEPAKSQPASRRPPCAYVYAPVVQSGLQLTGRMESGTISGNKGQAHMEDRTGIKLIRGLDLGRECTETEHYFGRGVLCRCGRYYLIEEDERHAAESPFIGALGDLGAGLASGVIILGIGMLVAFPLFVLIAWLLWR